MPRKPDDDGPGWEEIARDQMAKVAPWPGSDPDVDPGAAVAEAESNSHPDPRNR